MLHCQMKKGNLTKQHSLNLRFWGNFAPWSLPKEVEHLASQVVLVVKNLPANAGDARDMGLIPGSERSPWSRKCQPSLVFLPGKFHGQRIPAGYSHGPQ